MGIGGLREYSLSWNDKVNAGATPAKCTSAATAHRRVLGARPLIIREYVIFISVILSVYIKYLFLVSLFTVSVSTFTVTILLFTVLVPFFTKLVSYFTVVVSYFTVVVSCFTETDSTFTITDLLFSESVTTFTVTVSHFTKVVLKLWLSF